MSTTQQTEFLNEVEGGVKQILLSLRAILDTIATTEYKGIVLGEPDNDADRGPDTATLSPEEEASRLREEAQKFTTAVDAVCQTLHNQISATPLARQLGRASHLDRLTYEVIRRAADAEFKLQQALGTG